MAEITLPADTEALFKLGLRLSSPSQVNRSIWTGKRKVTGLPGVEQWLGSVSIEDIATEAEERAWRAFVFALGGPANWFKWYLPPNRHIGPMPLVNGADQTGYSLAIDGMTASSTILRKGQFISVPLASGHVRALCLTADLVSNASGQATAAFTPALGEAPANNAQIETANPYIPMSPVDTVLGLDEQQGISGTRFDVAEAM